MSEHEEEELEDFVRRLGRRSKSKVPLSVITRAALMVVMNAEEQIERTIESVGAPDKPQYNDKASWGRFEEYWINVFLRGTLRANPPKKQVG